MSVGGSPSNSSNSPIVWADQDVATNINALDPTKIASAQIVYQSFSGTDITAVAIFPDQGALHLGELQTISYSIHRENTPVRTLGHVNARGFVRGPRTIAGSLIFTQFNQYAFYRLYEMRNILATNAIYPLADMLPPFDILLTFLNESGMAAKLRIFGVTLLDEGGTMSVDDLVSEQTYTYIARGIQPLTAFTPQPKPGPDGPNPALRYG